MRPLSLHPVGTTYRRESWLRHALTWGYRTEQVPKGDSGNALPGALIALARQTVSRLAALRLDVGTDDRPSKIGETPALVDPLLDSLCQADLVWCVLAASTHTRNSYYPSFGSLYPQRTEPIVRRLVTDEGVISQMGLGSHDEVRHLIRDVIRFAESEGRWFGDWTTVSDLTAGEDHGHPPA